MRWGAFGGTTVIILVIILLQWSKLKQNPAKDNIAFFTLLAIGLVLSMFDLPHMGGPLTWLETLFKPFLRFLEK